MVLYGMVPLCSSFEEHFLLGSDLDLFFSFLFFFPVHPQVSSLFHHRRGSPFGANARIAVYLLQLRHRWSLGSPLQPAVCGLVLWVHWVPLLVRAPVEGRWGAGRRCPASSDTCCEVSESCRPRGYPRVFRLSPRFRGPEPLLWKLRRGKDICRAASLQIWGFREDSQGVVLLPGQLLAARCLDVFPLGCVLLCCCCNGWGDGRRQCCLVRLVRIWRRTFWGYFQ